MELIPENKWYIKYERLIDIWNLIINEYKNIKKIKKYIFNSLDYFGK